MRRKQIFISKSSDEENPLATLSPISNPDHFPSPPTCAMQTPWGATVTEHPIHAESRMILNLLAAALWGPGAQWRSQAGAHSSKWASQHHTHTGDSKLQAENSWHLWKNWIYLDKSRWRGWIISLQFITLQFIQKKCNITHYVFLSFHLLPLP